MSSDVRKVLRTAKDMGFSVEDTSRHIRLRHSVTGGMVVLSSTPSDRRFLQNALSDLRRASRPKVMAAGR
jgi:hypothetical protein